MSIYLLIAMSCDKLVCVIAPLKVKQILTYRKARCTFATILFFAMAISSFNLFDKRVFVLESESTVVNGGSDEINTTTSLDESFLSPFSSTIIIPTSTLTYALRLNNTAYNKTRYAPRLNDPAATFFTYDCDSNWPELQNDWLIVENIIRVFLPILSLIICNLWIVVALRKAKRNTNALFFTNSSTSATNLRLG